MCSFPFLCIWRTTCIFGIRELGITDGNLGGISFPRNILIHCVLLFLCLGNQLFAHLLLRRLTGVSSMSEALC